MSERGEVRPSVRRILGTLRGGATLDEVAVRLRLPVFRVRASLREAGNAGLVREENDVYWLTECGAAALLRYVSAAPKVESD